MLCSILTGPTQSGNSGLCDDLKTAVLPRLPVVSSVPEGTKLQGEIQPGGLVDLRGADPTLGGLLGGER